MVANDSIANTSSNVTINVDEKPIANTSSDTNISISEKKNAQGGGGSGSGSNDEICSPSWNCSDWGECINGTQTRKCVDRWNCGEPAPTETQICNIESEGEEEHTDIIEDAIEKTKEQIKEHPGIFTFLAGTLIVTSVYFYIIHRRKKNGYKQNNARLS